MENLGKTIVYLYTEIMPYQTIVYKEFSKLGYNLEVFFIGDNRQTPFTPESIDHVTYHNSSKLSKIELLAMVYNKQPTILVVCGWASTKYNFVAKNIRKSMNIPVVSPIDTQYIGSLKQKIGIIASPLYIKPLFTHIWVPGVRQFSFARQLGYDSSHIILNSLTGDVSHFKNVDISIKQTKYPKTFLYVGRYSQVKGLNILISAWDRITDKKGWRMTFAGNGPLKYLISNRDDFNVLDFQSQNSLLELAQNSGAFILPSLYEPWAIVLHEFSAGGLPIICSNACGASQHFVINGYNGYTFESGNINDLKNKIEKIINSSDATLIEMSLQSRKLSNYVDPGISVASLLSILQ